MWNPEKLKELTIKMAVARIQEENRLLKERREETQRIRQKRIQDYQLNQRPLIEISEDDYVEVEDYEIPPTEQP